MGILYTNILASNILYLTKLVVTMNGDMQILDLPDLMLANIAKYLTKPSIPLFAIAVTSQQASIGSSEASDITWQPTSTSNAIITGAYGERNTLDFGEIEESLASSLTDDHVRDILMCIDAINVLKVLKLTGIINIEGRGLDILRGSLMLECIEYEKQQYCKLPQANLSPSVIIISILESIVKSPGNKLQYIYFPDIVIPVSKLEKIFFPDIINNEDSVALVDNSNVLHVCVEGGSRCGALVKQRRTRRTRRPKCPYCQCKDIDLVMSQAGCSKTRALEALELNDWDVVDAIMSLTT